MNRLAMVSASALLLSFAVAMQACGSSDDSSTNTTNGGSGNATSTAGNTGVVSNGGTSGSGTLASGGTSTGGSTPIAGSSSGGSAGAATGGSSTGGSNSTAGAGGSGTAGGSSAGSGAGGGSAGTGSSLMTCTTEAKGGACTAATPEGMACAKSCGITALSPTKSETCTGGVYVEGTCTYPAGDYSCYKLPATLAACPGDAAGPVSGSACTAAACMPCGPNYQDSKMTAKTGYCVCSDAGKWSCASTKEWPPQM